MELTCKYSKREERKSEKVKRISNTLVYQWNSFWHYYLPPFVADFFLRTFLHWACQKCYFRYCCCLDWGAKSTILIAAMPAINLSIKHILAFSERAVFSLLFPLSFSPCAEDLHFAAFYFLHLFFRLFLPKIYVAALPCPPPSQLDQKKVKNRKIEEKFSTRLVAIIFNFTAIFPFIFALFLFCGSLTVRRWFF